MKVLVVDDNLEITEMLSKYLKLEGFDVTICNNGKEGLNKIKNTKYDNILLDLAMPGFSGIDVLETLHADKLLENNKIILFTASSVTQDEINRMLRLGAHSCIKKPVQMKNLLLSLHS